MARAVAPSNIELRIEPVDAAPEALRLIGIAYWELAGVDADSGDPVWTQRAGELGHELWSGSAHFAAAAGVVATALGYSCESCGGQLTLASRQALTDAVRGVSAFCRSCNRTVDERAAKILDPEYVREREERAAQVDVRRREAEAAEARERARREAITARYPVEPDSGEYLIDHASMLARIGALAVIHAVGDQGGLIYPVQYHDHTIGPNSAFSRELFIAAWHADLVQVHPSSPDEAFVWEDETRLSDRIFVDRARFFVPGEGTLTKRLEEFAHDLRVRLDLPGLWSTQRAEVAELAQRLVAEEAGRYFVRELLQHNLDDLTEKHEEALRTTTTRGASLFALGHLYRMAWSSARDASSAYQRHRGMSKENAITHGLKQLERWVQRALDDPTSLSEPFSENKRDLPLSAATGVVFRTILGLDPMSSAPEEVATALEGSPDAELIRRCDESIPSRQELMEWVRTSTDQWTGTEFRQVLARLEGWTPDLCAPNCAHERVAQVARESGRVYDRVVARTGDTDAAILTAEATGVANAMRDRVRTGDALLAELVRRLRLQQEF